MLKDKIVGLCKLNKITVKKLTIDLGFSEQSIYRWFKEDTLELKHLRKIANYFAKDISYFFESGETEKEHNIIQKNIDYKPEPNNEIKVLEEKVELYQKQVRYLEDHIETLKKHNYELENHLIKEKNQDN